MRLLKSETRRDKKELSKVNEISRLKLKICKENYDKEMRHIKTNIFARDVLGIKEKIRDIRHRQVFLRSIYIFCMIIVTLKSKHFLKFTIINQNLQFTKKKIERLR